jgi:hypothetical protein
MKPDGPADPHVPGEKSQPGRSPEEPVQEGSERESALSGAPGGIHNRPPIPGAGVKAECPKFMSHGPCGGVRKGGYCEVFPEMICPWVMMYFDLEKLGKLEWMTGSQNPTLPHA